MAHHALDRRIVVVGRGDWIGEHQPAVEDVEALVLHGPHVEIVGTENHERIEIVLEPEALLVPAKDASDAMAWWQRGRFCGVEKILSAMPGPTS
jgi:hypothetical protein